MPLIRIYSTNPRMPADLADLIGQSVSTHLDIPFRNVWVLWLPVDTHNFHCPAFPKSEHPTSPIVHMHCRETYSAEQLGRVLTALRELLALALRCDERSVFIIVDRVTKGNLMSYAEVWSAEDSLSDQIVMRAIGVVRSPVKNIDDDCWQDLVSTIELDRRLLEKSSLDGLKDFSHINVLFYLDRVAEDGVLTGSKHPRERLDWPKVGVLAQRVKDRPNRIGLSTCKVLDVAPWSITVSELDAIDGTPILDIKPFMSEFGPRSEVKQPSWSHQVMKAYFGGNNQRNPE